MKIFQILMAAITAFAITSGGAYATVIVALSGQAVSQLALNMCIGLGIIAAAKDVRSMMALPPLSNGNYDALTRFMQMTGKPGGPMIDPRLFRTAELEDGWKKAEPVDPPKP